ncbi:MAG: Ppx/GppA family phosphatase [Deltaproteobacteria bacterium]|nr:Ppx/GppA family phosphatase [Deltaproteobacteria bacterium]MBW1986519.1 Ppx/GppA family phosphatase [Deltaproteobacteria bacterium]MBW2135098.1 Ppx/GppA family phosphatase [Deltaproteobacteria bacterium]
MTDPITGLTELNKAASLIAAIDIGSLTIRLAIAEVGVDPPDLRLIHTKREITHLGQGLVQTGNLAPEAVDLSLAVLAEFVRDLRQFKVVASRAVATQAVRQARNRQAFLDQICRQTGLGVEVLSPAQEARLSLAGVLSVLTPADEVDRPLVVFDVGGGSTEWALVIPGQDMCFASLPLGVSTLTQRWLASDPPGNAELAALRTAIRHQLEQLPGVYFADYLLRTQPRLVGTAGTVTTLAAMSLGMTVYEPSRINNLVLTRATVDRLSGQLTVLTEAERARLPGLEPGKAGVIVAGALIIQKILEFFQQASLVVIDAGLLEGLLLQIAKEISFPKNSDKIEKIICAGEKLNDPRSEHHRV